jgi:serine phosphatase RsbU (regulator of sigma subunit)/predicted enzyme related to lactoylglutathione lyase
MIAHTPKPYDPRFQFAVVMVRDQDRSLRFYVEQLGFHLAVSQETPSGGCWIVVEPSDGSVQLALVRPQENSNAWRRIGEDTGMVLVTSDLEALCGEWAERGVSFPASPTEAPGQERKAIFQDIDGNRFTLVEHSPITEALDAERRAVAEKEQAWRMLATAANVMLDKHLVITEKEQAERLLARELEIARDVQARLLPQQTPSLRTLECAGLCIPARQVGGDYYDFLTPQPGGVALVLADIAGKGISGALLMANLQANLRSQFAMLPAFKEYFPLATDDLRHLLISVNRLFHETSSDSSYATLFVGNYNDATRQLSYANCGHPAPLLLRGDGDQFTVERLDSTSTVIGLFRDFDCHVVETQLAAGDILVIYSDGVTEAANTNGDEFGEDRLLEIAGAHRHLPMPFLVEKLVEAARQFSHPEQADDITVVAARCRE